MACLALAQTCTSYLVSWAGTEIQPGELLRFASRQPSRTPLGDNLEQHQCGACERFRRILSEHIQLAAVQLQALPPPKRQHSTKPSNAKYSNDRSERDMETTGVIGGSKPSVTENPGSSSSHGTPHYSQRPAVTLTMHVSQLLKELCLLSLDCL